MIPGSDMASMTQVMFRATIVAVVGHRPPTYHGVPDVIHTLTGEERQ